MFGLEGTRSCARRTTCDEVVAASLPLAMYAGELSRDYLSPLGKRFLQGVPPVTGRSEQSARLAANPRGSARQARRAPKKLARKMVARATGRTRPSYPRAPTAVCSPEDVLVVEVRLQRRLRPAQTPLARPHAVHRVAERVLRSACRRGSSSAA